MLLAKLRSAYLDCALILVNTCVLVIALNVVLGMVFAVKDRSTREVPDFGPAGLRTRLRERGWTLDRVYPELDFKSVDQLLTETWINRRFVYQPYTQFTEAPYHGRFVNVTEAGFRQNKIAAPWPPLPDSFNVFLFGGSTTFSYGLPDGQTLASCLEEEVAGRTKRRIRVYNFGRADYRSTQERILFQQLLLEGRHPDLAVFVDGFNDMVNVRFPWPMLTPNIQEFFVRHNENQWYTNLLDDTSAVPMVRLAGSLRAQARKRQTQSSAPPLSDDQAIQAGVERYLANQRQAGAVAKEFGVPAAYIWQPVPDYKYNKKYYLLGENAVAGPLLARAYARMRQAVDTKWPGANFLWCADIQASLTEPLYLDRCHYTAAMTRRVAQSIAGFLIQRGLISALPMVH